MSVVQPVRKTNARSVSRLGLRRPTVPLVGAAPSVGVLPFDVTIIVPTRNEAGNVPELLRRLDAALGAISAEVLFVDDSDDETPAVILAEAQRSSRHVRVVHRAPGEREGKLGGAVVMGFRLAQAPWALVMDGDLQHPPEVVPQLVAATGADDVDLVYGSRYAGTGDAAGLGGRTRAWVSASSTVLAKAAFPRKLRGMSDPMSGLFAVRLASLNLATLRPPGYKILLEILAVSRLRRTVSVPFSFQPRFSGTSKASVAEGLRYLKQLLALRTHLSVARLLQLAAFLAVGLSGVVANTVVLWLLSERWWHEPYLLASFVATNVAIVWNFALFELFVFRGRRRYSSWAGFLRFWGLNMALLPLQLGLLTLSIEVFNMNTIVANVFSLGIVFVVRYVVTTTWVYQRDPAAADAADPVALLAPELVPAAVGAAGPRHRVGGGRGVAPSGALLHGAIGLARRSLLAAVPVLLRLGVAVVAALLAFPAIAVHEWQSLTRGGLPAVEVLTALTAALVLVVVRAVPATGEPDVHDRQVDFILALPALGAALFLTFAWPTHLGSSGTLGPREVAAFLSFFVGACLLVLGTRCTARIRWVFYLQLLMLPVVSVVPVLVGVVVVSFVAATVAAAARSTARATSGPAELRVERRQQLPPWQPAAVAMVVLAGALGFLAIGRPSPVPAAMPAQRPVAGAAADVPTAGPTLVTTSGISLRLEGT